MTEDITFDLIFRFLALNVSLLGALVFLDHIKSGFNNAVLSLVARAKTATNSKLFAVVVGYGSIATVSVILLLFTGLVFPWHDFVIIGAPNSQALFASVRTIVIGIAALVALPALLIGFLMLVGMYSALLVDAALALTGGRMSSVLSVLFAITSTYFLLSQTTMDIAFVFIVLQVTLLFIVYVMHPDAAGGNWTGTRERMGRAFARVIALAGFSVALAVATFAIWLAYFSIHIADNHRVEWAEALDCPVRIGGLLTIDDFFLSETVDRRGGLVRPMVRIAPESLNIDDRSYGFAARTSGRAQYARIRIQAIQNLDNETPLAINETGAGGYFLRKGFFVFSFNDTFEEGMSANRVGLPPLHRHDQ